MCMHAHDNKINLYYLEAQNVYFPRPTVEAYNIYGFEPSHAIHAHTNLSHASIMPIILYPCIENYNYRS